MNTKIKHLPRVNIPRLLLSGCIAFVMCAAQALLVAQGQNAVLKAATDGSTVLVEAESFASKGGWVVDQQYMDQMGSPVALAHGMGKPVADAATEVVFPKTGTYRVFVRTRNWVAKWTPQHAPGVFNLSVNGAKLGTTFGDGGADWHWQDGGTVVVSSSKVRLALHDLTGFDGRCDAILFAADPKFTPPEGEALAAFRRAALGLPADPQNVPNAPEGPFDLVVAGGGMAGICTAVSAARLGVKVALIQNRPLLGGNNSSEVRVSLRGRINYPPYENIGNLVGELDPMQTGSMLVANGADAEKYRDDKKLALVLAEKNITLYLSTHVMAVEMEKAAPSGYDRPAIKAVIAKNIETGRELRFEAKLFADCTGDASLAVLAGAEWRMWPETRAETGEPTAPAQRIKQTMGASMLWNTKDAGRATTFPKLPWAVQFTDESAINEITKGTWRWETGLNIDQVEKAEEIRDRLFRAVYGHWAYLKNQSPRETREKVASLNLNWVAFIAGKRESRRIMGDHILCEQDFDERKVYDDGCVMTTWTIDLHVPTDHNAKYFPGEEFFTVAKHKKIESYLVPYRCLYSRSVPNLFMAGRNISVTRVALGTIRVMRTTGMMGEVVGMAASLCKQHNATPRGVYKEHLPELVELMKKGVAEKPAEYGGNAAPKLSAPTDAKNEPALLKNAGVNLALKAKVEVSSVFPNMRYPAKNINDGKYDYNNNRTRWASAQEEGEQYAILKFSEPVTVNAVRIISGEKPGINPNRDFVLQYKKPGSSQWTDITETKRRENKQVDLGMRFPAVTASEFRLLITKTSGNISRLWELELYELKN